MSCVWESGDMGMIAEEILKKDLQEVCDWLFQQYKDSQSEEEIARTYGRFLAVNYAIQQLRTLESVKPEKRELPFGLYDAVRYEYTCGACGCGLMNNERWRTKFCPECGKKVLWNADT